MCSKISLLVYQWPHVWCKDLVCEWADFQFFSINWYGPIFKFPEARLYHNQMWVPPPLWLAEKRVICIGESSSGALNFWQNNQAATQNKGLLVRGFRSHPVRRYNSELTQSRKIGGKFWMRNENIEKVLATNFVERIQIWFFVLHHFKLQKFNAKWGFFAFFFNSLLKWIISGSQNFTDLHYLTLTSWGNLWK